MNAKTHGPKDEPKDFLSRTWDGTAEGLRGLGAFIEPETRAAIRARLPKHFLHQRINSSTDAMRAMLMKKMPVGLSYRLGAALASYFDQENKLFRDTLKQINEKRFDAEAKAQSAIDKASVLNTQLRKKEEELKHLVHQSFNLNDIARELSHHLAIFDSVSPRYGLRMGLGGYRFIEDRGFSHIESELRDRIATASQKNVERLGRLYLLASEAQLEQGEKDDPSPKEEAKDRTS